MLKNKKPSKKVIVAIVLAVALIGIGSYFLVQHQREITNRSDKTAGKHGPINLHPSTKEDSKRVNSTKQAIIDQEQKENSSNAQASSGKKSVKPVITYAGQHGGSVDVGGYIGGIFEQGGVCTATFSLGAQSFTKTVNAVEDASSVDCPTLSAQTAEFSPKGTWTVVLSYNSASAAGSSDGRQFGVQ